MYVMLIYGPPASGKTTYVRNHMQKGDLVVDFDLIKQSLTMGEKTTEIGKLYGLAEEIRQLIYRKIEAREELCERAWVIASLADGAERNEVINRLRPDRIIKMETSHGECISHALQDDDRNDKDLQIRIIDKWFDNHTSNQFNNHERWD